MVTFSYYNRFCAVSPFADNGSNTKPRGAKTVEELDEWDADFFAYGILGPLRRHWQRTQPNLRIVSAIG
jgi:hypothetical protein